jgi:hypothetical protein
MRAKRLLAGVVAGGTALAVLVGCAAQQIQALEPRLELRDAVQRLADVQQAGFTLKLTGDADDLIAAADDEMTTEDATTARQLFNSSVTIAYDRGGAGAQDDRSMVAVTVDGVTGTEIRYIGGLLYAKAPVTALAEKFGATAADVKSLGELPGLAAFADGRWVSVDSKEVIDLAGAETGLPTRDLEQATTVDELIASARNLLGDASVVRDSADATHLIVTSSTAKAYAEAKRFATAVSASLAEELTDAPSDRPVVLDLWIDDGRLTAAEINILQFVDGATGRVAARLEVATGAPITVPDGATKLDLAGLLQA